MSKHPSQEFWLRCNGNFFALFRYNGDGTVRVTAIESSTRAYDLAGVRPPEAAEVWHRLKAMGYRGVWPRDVQAAGMTPLRLVEQARQITGSVVRRYRHRPAVVIERIVRVRVTRRVRLHAPDWQLNPPERPLTDEQP